MPKKIDAALRERAVRLVLEHQQEYPSLTAAIEAVAKQLSGSGVGAPMEHAPRGTRSSRSVGSCASRAARSPHGPTGLDAARPSGRRPHRHRRPGHRRGPGPGLDHRRRTAARRMTPEGLYGRRKMTTLVQRERLPEASAGASTGRCGARPDRDPRDKGIRTTIPAKDGKRAGDLLDRDFTAPAPNRTWVMDFTYVRTWAGFVYVAFILDVFAQKIVAWNCRHVQGRRRWS